MVVGSLEMGCSLSILFSTHGIYQIAVLPLLSEQCNRNLWWLERVPW